MSKKRIELAKKILQRALDEVKKLNVQVALKGSAVPLCDVADLIVKASAAPPKEFYILSSECRGDTLLWWRPNNSGYTRILAHAGRYSDETVQKHWLYYNNKQKCLPVPCDVVDSKTFMIVPDDCGHFDLFKKSRPKRAKQTEVGGQKNGEA